ncbi:MAG: peroxiredoxin [Planctomycetota bacterium]|jgi:peroxiredoxin Q/BCP
MRTLDREILRGLLLAAAALAFSGPVSVADGTASDKDVDLQVGEPAPVFTSIDDESNAWTSSDHVGKGYLVVFFYPADFTSCCTRQAVSFRDHRKALSDRGVQVVGVSGDRAANHRLFREAWKLNFTLLGDEQARVAKKFGVPSGKGGCVRPRGPDRKPIAGPHGRPLTLHREATLARWTFVIGKDGTIIYKTTCVNASCAAEQVLEFIERLTQEESPVDAAFAR